MVLNRIQNKLKLIGSYLIYLLNLCAPKNEKYIVFHSEPDFSDNSRSVYEELIRLEYNKKYKIIWITKNEDIKKKPYNVLSVKHYSLKGVWYFIHSKYLFTSHSLWVNRVVRGKQILINLWHGMPLKRIGVLEEKVKKSHLNNYDIMPVSSELYRIVMSKCFETSLDKHFISGLPRNDDFFKGDSVKDLIRTKKSFSKLVIWMPTFRKAAGRAEDGKIGEIGIPILKYHEIKNLDIYLSNLDILLILKLHPYQQKNVKEAFNNCYNIILTDNTDIFNEYSLYNLIGCADGLLTDYSSVYVDYLCLNRPIGFVYDDLTEYQQTRGFVFDDIVEFMPGAHIQSIEELYKYFDDLSKGVDNYVDKRIEINKILNRYSDGNNTSRLIKYLCDYYDFN